mgnify:FL=1
MLVFFRNVMQIGDVYDYITAKIGQQPDCHIEDRTVHMFHLGTHENRKKIILQLMTASVSRMQIVLCSSSFSLGLNLAGIKYVVHYGVPSSVEDYVQEVGRAARELGLTGHAILLAYKNMTIGRPIAQTMKEFFRTVSCRRKVLNDYLQIETVTPSNSCCDACDWDLPTGNLPITRLLTDNVHVPDMDMLTISSVSSAVSTPDLSAGEQWSPFSESDASDF